MPEDINSLFWNKEVFNGAKIREYSKKEGANPGDFEKQIWEYDTLFILKEFSFLDLFFKGGTCVQSLLPLNFQRFSVDLDFNIEAESRTNDFILRKFADLNDKLKEKNLLIPASETKYKDRSSGNLVYGKFYPLYFDEISGTVSFARVFMSKVVSRNINLVYRNELIEKSLLGGVFNHILVQVNMKHQIPALKWSLQDINLRIRKYPEYNKIMQFKCLSNGDLFADKLIAFRNRKDFKDMYDLGMMAKTIKDSDLEVSRQKINQIFSDKKIIPDVLKTIESSLKAKAYLRYMSALPREVAPIIRDRTFYTKLMDIVSGL